MTVFIQFLLVFSGLFVLMACESRQSYEGLKLPVTPISTIQTYYGVVDFAYIRLRQEPKQQSSLVTILRGGTIVEIVTSLNKEEILEGKPDRWYQVSFQGRRGWVFGSYLKIFDSLNKARNAAVKASTKSPSQ